MGSTTAEVFARQAAAARTHATMVDRRVGSSRSATSSVAKTSSNASTSLRPTAQATGSTTSGESPTSNVAANAGHSDTLRRTRK
jgi:hypothetical protein